MQVILNFAYSPDTNGYCKFPPRLDSVNTQNVHDGNQEYAGAITDACIKAAKKAIETVSRQKSGSPQEPVVIPSCHLQR